MQRLIGKLFHCLDLALCFVDLFQFGASPCLTLIQFGVVIERCHVVCRYVCMISLCVCVCVCCILAMRYLKLDNTRKTDDANTQVYE